MWDFILKAVRHKSPEKNQTAGRNFLRTVSHSIFLQLLNFFEKQTNRTATSFDSEKEEGLEKRARKTTFFFQRMARSQQNQ